MKAVRLIAALGCAIAADTASAALKLELRVAGVESGALRVDQLALGCTVDVAADRLRCRRGSLRAARSPAGALSGRFDATLARDGAWTAAVAVTRSSLGALSADGASQRGGYRFGLHGAALGLRGAQRVAARLGWVVPGEFGGSAAADVEARSVGDGLQARYRVVLSQATYGEPSGRYAAEQLALRAQGDLRWRRGQLEAHADIGASAGQAYVEPLFADFDAEPVEARLRLRAARDGVRLDGIELQQRGIGRMRGSVVLRREAPHLAAELRFVDVQLTAAFARYGAPLLAGSRWQDLALSGSGDAGLLWRDGGLRQLQLELREAAVDSPGLRAGLSGLDGALRWSADAESRSALRWRSAHWADLPIGGAQLEVAARGRSLRLLQALRLPVLDGALHVQRLELGAVGTPQASARFQAEIEPIDLAQLCRALGWPPFGGVLSGRLPGLSLNAGELRLDGGLSARAFDGDIAVENLRLIDAFGRLPRLLADIRLRHLDLAAVTQAFSFGRIEGRLHGDVEQLRLLGWRPVAFRARLYTPPGDRSRHRISQRAIDTISAIGGGPTGLLSRGLLRFFEDFGYRRIGWSCVLTDGVCHMDGLKPADDGGYVLVEGRRLPRIDVIGHEHEVAWDRFVAQLMAVRGAQGVELR